MPGMSGIDTLRALKKLDPYAHIIMLTSIENPVVAENCAVLGAKDFIRKNVGHEELNARLKAAIDGCF